MPPRRRREDTSFVGRIYNRLTPEIQIVGFIMLCTFIFTVSYTKFDAYGAILDDHEKRIRNIEQLSEKLDTIIKMMREDR